MSTSNTNLGDFVGWDGGCLLIGSRTHGVVPLHAHYAIQIAFGTEPGICFRATEDEAWTDYGAGAMIPSRQPHSMDARALAYWVVMFVEPETHEGRTLTERWLANGITALPDELVAAAAPAIVSAWKEQRDARAVERVARELVRRLTDGVEPVEAPDERILRATAYIRSHLDGALSLEEVAAEACLSPSRFRHLFVEQTGMALRPYILWRRFLRVWELLMAGETISSAAHEAGFADAAHLTRTSRRMFGFPPSVLQVAGLLRDQLATAPRDAYRAPGIGRGASTGR